MLAQSGPNFRPDLTTVIKAPNGDYACFAGMWLDKKNEYAYLEPLAAVPEYRRMGLATVALTEGMKKTKALGAKYCFGGCRISTLQLDFGRFAIVRCGKENGLTHEGACRKFKRTFQADSLFMPKFKMNSMIDYELHGA